MIVLPSTPSIAQLGELCQAINPAYDGLDRDMRELCRNRALSILRSWGLPSHENTTHEAEPGPD